MGLFKKIKMKFRKKSKKVKTEIKEAVKEELTEVKRDLKEILDYNQDGKVNFKDFTKYLRDELKEYLDEDDNGHVDIGEVLDKVQVAYVTLKR